MDADSIALKVLDHLLKDACDESVLLALTQEKQLRGNWGRAEPIAPSANGELVKRSVLVERVGVDIYGLPKSNETRYFTCKNCGRQVAGNRFAVHVSKCITRGRRQRTNY